MLVLSRRIGEKLIIGDSITITILNNDNNQIRLGIEAPKNISMHRQEVYQRIKREEEPTLANLGDVKDDAALDIMIQQIDFLRVLTAAKDITDFRRRLTGILHSLGFSDFAVTHITANGPFEEPLTSLPDELMASYREQRLYQQDMVRDYVMTGNSAPVYYSMIRRTIESATIVTGTFKKNLDILALYERFDYNDAYLIPVQPNRGEVEDRVVFSILSKGTTPEDFLQQVNRCKPVLQLLADAVNFIGDSKYPSRPLKPPITAKPLRLLTTLAKQDLLLSEAASVLHISVDTANKHIALAKKALGTNSQANAVYLAIKRGLIDLS